MCRIAPALTVLALAVCAAAPPAADAAFPGRNGKVVFGWFSFMETEEGPPSTTVTAIQATGPTGGRAATLRGCTKTTGRPNAGDCSIAYGAPAVSPNGRLVAFDAGNALALMRIDGSGFRRLPARSADDGDPAFSPSGKRLAFSAGGIAVAQQPPPPRAIWTSDLAGGAARRVTSLGASPSWSTHDWIAFLRADGVYRVRPNGRRLRRLVRLARCSDVDWSPGGTKLAFACLTPHSGGRLYVADGDGRHLHRVALRFLSPQAVAWAPDGKRLAVASFDGSVVTVRLDGTHERGIVDGGSGALYTFGAGRIGWQPLPR